MVLLCEGNELHILHVGCVSICYVEETCGVINFT